VVFSSPIFLFIFLPLFFAFYFLTPRRWRNLIIIGASALFYAWGEAKLIVVMMTSTAVDYLCALVIANNSWQRMWSAPRQLTPDEPRTRTQRLAVIVSLAVNLSFLLYFKYAGWGLENFTHLLQSLGIHGGLSQLALHTTLPLGISFYTFQSISYTLDVYRGKALATRHILNYATLISKFPLLIAGPIVRYADVAQQLITRTITTEKFAYGIRRFIVGLGKKVLIANTVAVPADAIFALPVNELTAGLAWLAAVSYAMQIYFDFSGYSDMAIGLGHMMGFTFLENFNYPYISRSLREFWRRWHISLSSWFRDYLYIPLGGNRRGAVRTGLNLLIVFFVTGLWHGANWTFVVWGLWHGSFLLLERWRQGRWLEAWPTVLQSVYTLAVVLIGWIFFRAETFTQAAQFLTTMFGLRAGATVVDGLGVFLTPKVSMALVIGAIASTPMLRLWTMPRVSDQTDDVVIQPAHPGWRLGLSICLGLVFLVSVMQLASGTHNPFIYFRF
jgi:alginate O-acetyltransferase complex protein AlgI